MHTAASRSPGNGGRRSGRPIDRYQKDTSPLTNSVGASTGFSSMDMVVSCSLSEDRCVVRAEGKPDSIVGVGRAKGAGAFAHEDGGVVVQAYLDLARIAEV